MASLHPVIKGKVGELSIRKDLIKHYNIYLPECDTAQVDLIVECGPGIMKRVQIKTSFVMKTETSLEVDTRKYVNTGRVDVVAIYYEPNDDIAYVPYENTDKINLALYTAKNNQTKNRKWFYSYRRFPEFS